ncbi:MAG: LPXTG cell wall anchor domain-containing protein, partial [Clostridia bacterium]|nr:LPXTG cell wall anchor domain-containing protein [Clostridia bacterium]
LSTLTSDVDGIPGTGDIATGTVNVSIRNNAGATLPSTGGIGTTIFYVAGILLIAAAAAVVIIRKRSEAK